MPSKINLKQILYLILALAGGGYTFYLVMQGVEANNGNFNVLAFIKSTWIDNYYAKSLSIDFWTGAIAGTCFMLFEGLRLKMKYLWVYIALTFMIAFAFAFPMFLFVREAKLRKLNQV
jgi:hypothetical protein